jgi:hypothetical protein
MCSFSSGSFVSQQHNHRGKKPVGAGNIAVAAGKTEAGIKPLYVSEATCHHARNHQLACSRKVNEPEHVAGAVLGTSSHVLLKQDNIRAVVVLH